MKNNQRFSFKTDKHLIFFFNVHSKESFWMKNINPWFSFKTNMFWMKHWYFIHFSFKRVLLNEKQSIVLAFFIFQGSFKKSFWMNKMAIHGFHSKHTCFEWNTHDFFIQQNSIVLTWELANNMRSSSCPNMQRGQCNKNKKHGEATKC